MVLTKIRHIYQKKKIQKCIFALESAFEKIGSPLKVKNYTWKKSLFMVVNRIHQTICKVFSRCNHNKQLTYVLHVNNMHFWDHDEFLDTHEAIFSKCHLSYDRCHI